MRENCGCPVPCHFAIYDPSVSYASISNHLVTKLLTSNESKNLKQSLELASEVTARMDKDTLANFHSLVDNFFKKYADVHDTINEIIESLLIQRNTTNRIEEDMKHAYYTKERIYRYQEYAIEKNFLRGREAMEERTLANVANAFAEFALLNRRRITRLAHDNGTNDDVRLELYKLTVDALQTRQDIVEMARHNISLLISSYINGTKIFNYKFEDLPRAHNPYIIPKPLMNYSMHHNSYMLKYVPKLKTNDFDLLNKTLEMFKEQAKIAYEDRTVNESELNYVYERFQYACRTYMYSKSVVYSMGIEMPLYVIKERRSDFDKNWSDFEEDIRQMYQNLESLSNLVENVTTTFIPLIESLVVKLQNYTQNGDGTLMDLAMLALSNETQSVISTIRNFFREVRTRGQLIDDEISLAYPPIFTMWTMIIDDEDSVEYYNYTNNALFLRDLGTVKEEWKKSLEAVRAEDIRKHVQSRDEDFLTAFEEIANHLEAFQNSITVDENFVK